MGYNKKHHIRKIESFYRVFTALTQNYIFIYLKNVITALRSSQSIYATLNVSNLKYIDVNRQQVGRLFFFVVIIGHHMFCDFFNRNLFILKSTFNSQMREKHRFLV